MSVSQGRLDDSSIMRTSQAVPWCCFYSRWGSLGSRHCSSCYWSHKGLAMVAYTLKNDLAFRVITGNNMKLTRHNINSNFSSRISPFSKKIYIIFKSMGFGPQRIWYYLFTSSFAMLGMIWYRVLTKSSQKKKRPPFSPRNIFLLRPNLQTKTLLTFHIATSIYNVFVPPQHEAIAIFLYDDLGEEGVDQQTECLLPNSPSPDTAKVV